MWIFWEVRFTFDDTHFAHSRVHCFDAIVLSILLQRIIAVNAWNENAHHLVGYTPGEVMGRSLIQDFIISDFKEAYQSVFSEALHGKKIPNLEFLLKRKRDGAMIKVLMNATVQRDEEQGRPIGVLCIGQEITIRDNEQEGQQTKPTKNRRSQ